jgi:hypothetical protein
MDKVLIDAECPCCRFEFDADVSDEVDTVAHSLLDSTRTRERGRIADAVRGLPHGMVSVEWCATWIRKGCPQ